VGGGGGGCVLAKNKIFLLINEKTQKIQTQKGMKIKGEIKANCNVYIYLYILPNFFYVAEVVINHKLI
jgi:hypothetical protein